MAFWNRYEDADRLQEAALGYGSDGEEPSTAARPLGLIAVAAVVVLVVMFLVSGPSLRLVDDAPTYPADEIAAQRVADISAERELARTRWGFRQSETIDAHTSSFQAQVPPR
jgi:hypothetical protein